MRKLLRKRRIAIALSVINVLGFISAMGDGSPLHAGAHVAVGVVLFLWIQRLSERVREGHAELAEPADQDRIEGLESEMDQLRRELAEAQERLDFTERMMAQRPIQNAAAPRTTPDRS